MELDCDVGASELEVPDERRWTPGRNIEVARAYRSVLRLWRAKPWRTSTAGHVCSPQCRQVIVRNIVICAHSGALHACGDVCDRAVLTHEARVCTLTSRAFPRDMCADVFDQPSAPPPAAAATQAQQNRQRRVKSKQQSRTQQLYQAGVPTLLPLGTPASVIGHVCDVVWELWELLQTSAEWPRLKSGYLLLHHGVAVVRLMARGMNTPEGLCIVPQVRFVTENAPSLKFILPHGARLYVHTRATKAFRRLLHGVDNAALAAHSERMKALVDPEFI